MKNVCVVTGTRAEYGLLKPILQKINLDKDLNLQLVVTGMHLCPEFGLTYKEIEADGFVIEEKIDVVLSSDAQNAMTKSIGLAMVSFADYFARSKPDLVIVLGDRYEIFAVATTVAIAGIPLAHLCGGDTTEGAVDEFFRHSITKMSYLHFTTTLEYKKRVEQLGEAPDRVFCVGATGVENILNVKLMDLEQISKSLKFDLSKPFSLVTFHPATMENNCVETQVNQLFQALDSFSEMNFIFTKANSDANGRIINELVDKYVEGAKNCVVYTSLGLIRYLSAMKYCTMVIGNSSSGIYEAPSFKVPTINIGDRQKGRLQAKSVINCEAERDEIVSAIKYAMSTEFLENLTDVQNPYEGVNPSGDIVRIIKEFLLEDKIDIKKKFYDL
ncbi:MAG: UDP-N-acetyl-D-glucosamine 2-epimerase, UDP-hydrolysing [Epulopiscium sp. Nele67-Bin005]|nr:MAG: UDP-N-acetyl-D-glucosamine 2-epimerase, UDP-hydrolysing [Epulopiscium sp. Nele67-Bin005]